MASVLAALAGCSSPPPRPVFPDIRFTSEPPIELDIAAVEVRTTYQMPFRAPNVEHVFPVPPSRAMENWAHDRLKAVGYGSHAVFTIKNASVIETELPKKEGLQGVLTTEPAERYDIAIEATLQIEENGVPRRTADVKASLSKSLLEGITPNDRDKAQYDMTKQIMADFDKQMESEIRNNFGTYVLK